MGADTLEVCFDDGVERDRVTLSTSPSSCADRLARDGCVSLRVFGLGRMGAKGFNGNPIDSYLMPIEHDLAFLLEHYLALEELVAERRGGRLSTYVADGCLELSSVIVGSIAHVRVGFFEDPSFEEPFAEGVSIDVRAYLRMWRSFASAVVEGASGRGVQGTAPD